MARERFFSTREQSSPDTAKTYRITGQPGRRVVSVSVGASGAAVGNATISINSATNAAYDITLKTYDMSGGDYHWWLGKDESCVAELPLTDADLFDVVIDALGAGVTSWCTLTYADERNPLK